MRDRGIIKGYSGNGSRMTGWGRTCEGTQKDMGRAEFQTKSICLSLRPKRGGRGDQGWSMGLKEERGRPKKQQ